ncbi:hypothetical protein [Actinomycetospora chlora]|uniref:hypothetical protein n=1 Tax=Actinomycetospora chlora TaxID=663608 RepID=UPI0031E6983B
MSGTLGFRQPERGPPVDASTPRTIVLAGEIGPPEMISLANYCEHLERGGQTDLHLNMAAVTHCGREGLDGLLALVAGPGAMTVTVDGARWRHFMQLLSTAPIVEMQGLCDSVRMLLPRPATGSA